MKEAKSCGLRVPIEVQRATNDTQNATPPATEAQPESLKALLHKRLRRNNTCNNCATDPQKGVQHSPQNAPPKVAQVADLYGRRQCQSCNHWKVNRCVHKQHMLRDNAGFLLIYAPDPEQWWRCKFHSSNRQIKQS